MKIFIICLIAVAGFCETGAYYSAVSLKSTSNINFSCLRSKGYKYIMIRGYLSYGKPDPNVAKNFREAIQGTSYYPRVAINPCISCPKSPEEQITELIKAIDYSKEYRIVVKVELSDNWGPYTNKNCDYLKLLLKTILNNGKLPQIQSDAPVFNKIMGQSCDVASIRDITVVWDKHDESKEINNFVPFGGIKQVWYKEYSSGTICHTYLDLITLISN